MNQKVLNDILDNPHIIGYLIGKNKLTELHSYWIKYIWYPREYFYQKDNAKKMIDFFNSLGKCFETVDENNKIKRIYLTKEIFFRLIDNSKHSLKAHRGSYKTSALASVGCICRMLFDPNIRICIVQKDFTKSSLILQTIKNGMLVPEVKQLFKMAHDNIEPRAITKRDNILTFNFKKDITPEGNINAFGIHQNMIGKHFDFILADDFVTLDDKISKAEREKTKARLEDIKTNVLDPGKQMGLSGTIWHREDAWMICPPAIIFDVYMLNIFNEQEKQLKKKELTPVSWAANYELRHVASENQLFQEAHYKQWDFHYKTSVYSHLDAKYKGDHTNALCFMVKKDDGRIQAIGFTFKEHIQDKLDFVAEKWKKYFSGTLYCEENADQGFLANKLREFGIPVETYHEKMNKHVKISNYGYKHWNNIDWCPDSDPEYISQILDYTENSEPDDCADNFSSLIRQRFDESQADWSRWRWN